MRLVRMLQHNGVIPFLVFDGDYLPSKASTEEERKRSRERSKVAGLELLNAGKVTLAWKELSKAVDVTPEMAKMFIEELKKANVQYIVAPYEADPQMVYLERKGYVSAILSEDSDLLVFGSKCLLTKLDKYGNCVEINQADFSKCKEMDLTGWSEKQFRHMAILSGCDYLASVKGMGLKTAYRFMRKHQTAERIIHRLKFDGKYQVPKDYLESFYRAELTFLHQRVFCPDASKLVHHLQPQEPLDDNATTFIGIPVDDKISTKVATGDLDPITKMAFNLDMRDTYTTYGGENTPPCTPGMVSTFVAGGGGGDPRYPRSTTVRPRGRVVLGELDPNLFAPSPSQLQALARNRGQWPADPLDGLAPITIAANRRAVSAPHRASTENIPPRSAPSRPVRRTQTDLTAFGIQSSRMEPRSEPRPAKRSRLSDVSVVDNISASTPVYTRSRFFDDSEDSPSSSIFSQSKKHKGEASDYEDEMLDSPLSDTSSGAMCSNTIGLTVREDSGRSVMGSQSSITYDIAPGLTDGESQESTASVNTITDTADKVDYAAINAPATRRTLTPFIRQFTLNGAVNSSPVRKAPSPLHTRSPAATPTSESAFMRHNTIKRAISSAVTPLNPSARNKFGAGQSLLTPPYTPVFSSPTTGGMSPSYIRSTNTAAGRQTKPKPAGLGGVPFPEVATQHSRRVVRQTSILKMKVFPEDVPLPTQNSRERMLLQNDYDAKVEENDEDDDILSSPPVGTRRISFGKFAFKG